MSILVKEDYANPATPLWAAAGSIPSVEVPKMKYGTDIPVSWTFTSTGPEQIANFVDSVPPAVNGFYNVMATFNYRLLAPSAFTGCVGQIEIAPTIAQLDMGSSTGEDISGTVTMTYPYTAGNPIPAINIIAQVTDDNSQNATLQLTWFVVFYPDV